MRPSCARLVDRIKAAPCRSDLLPKIVDEENATVASPSGSAYWTRVQQSLCANSTVGGLPQLEAALQAMTDERALDPCAFNPKADYSSILSNVGSVATSSREAYDAATFARFEQFLKSAAPDRKRCFLAVLQKALIDPTYADTGAPPSTGGRSRADAETDSRKAALIEKAQKDQLPGLSYYAANVHETATVAEFRRKFDYYAATDDPDTLRSLSAIRVAFAQRIDARSPKFADAKTDEERQKLSSDPWYVTALFLRQLSFLDGWAAALPRKN
jgi:hypothetical protein